MKIYIKDLDINSSINTKNLYKISKMYNYIYSDHGIYLIQNNQVNKLIPNDMQMETYKLNDIDFIVDYSHYTFRKDYSIPYDHIVQTIEKNMYTHDDSSVVSLVIEKNMDKIMDVYFEVSTTSQHKFGKVIEDDIIKYLSLFSDIKHN